MKTTNKLQLSQETLRELTPSAIPQSVTTIPMCPITCSLAAALATKNDK